MNFTETLSLVDLWLSTAKANGWASLIIFRESHIAAWIRVSSRQRLTNQR